MKAEFSNHLINGSFASLGASVNYLWSVYNRRIKFRFVSFVAFAAFGLFLGVAIGSFIPEGFAYRDGLLLLCGFALRPIFDIIENKLPDVLLQRISLTLNGEAGRCKDRED